MADEQNIFADPEFRKLSGVEKIQVLDQLDPDFAKLPSNKKPGVIFDAINGVPMAPKNKGLFYQAGEFAKTLGKDVVGATTGAARTILPEIDILRGTPTTAEQAVGAQVEQFKKAGEEFKQGRYSEAVGHGLAGALPLVGPLAAQTGEEVGEGEYGRAAAHGLELSAPYTARPIARGAAATVRGGARAVQDVAGTASRVTDLPVIRNVPFVRDIRGMLRDIAGRNPGMSAQELAQGLYKEVNGRAPKTAGEKIEAVRMYREALKPARAPKQPARFKVSPPEKPTVPKESPRFQVSGPEKPTASTPPAEPARFRVPPPERPPRPKPARGGGPGGPVEAPAPGLAGGEGPPGPASPTPFGRERFQAVAAQAKDQAILPTLDELKLSPEEIENPNVLSDADMDKIIDKVNAERQAFNKTAQEKGLNKLSIFKHPDPKMQSYRTYQELRTSWARAKRIRDALKAKPPGSVQ